MNIMNRKSKVNIAVVDDSELSRRSIVEALDNEGFNVVGEVESATEAIKMSHQANCNIWIIDVVMPEISGIELAKHLTDNSRGVSIIMISSLKMENIIIESISNGAIDFLQKPFDKEDLIRSVNKIADQVESDKDL